MIFLYFSYHYKIVHHKTIRKKFVFEKLSVKFQEPLKIDYDAGYDEILETVMLSIGQSLTQQETGTTP